MGKFFRWFQFLEFLAVVFLVIFFLWGPDVFAQEQKIIYPRDKFGNELKHKGGYVVEKDGRLVAVDFVGNKQPHKEVVICVKSECQKGKK